MSSPLTRRSFIAGTALACTLGALGGLAGCGGGAQSGTSASGTPDQLTIVYNDAPTSFDPANRWDGWYTVCRGLTETLVAFDESMNLRPLLATNWENVDRLTWRFTLRPGVSFQSGAPFTPDAVKASLERSVAKSKRAASKLHLDRIEVDEDGITVITAQPVATLPGELAEPVFSIVDTATVEDDPAHAGTGPYEGDDTGNTQDFTLKAFAGYWGGAPAVPALQCRTITDASARALGLQSGEANIACSLLATDLKTLQGKPGYTVLTNESVRTVFVICNFKNPLLADPAVRRALSCATDRETLANTLLGGSLVPNGAPFPSYLPYSRAVQDVAQTYDLDRAKQLLADAGYADSDGDGVLEKDGRPLSFTLAYYGSRPELPLLAPALQDAYGKIGVRIVPQQYENVDAVFYSGDFDLMLYNTTTVGNGDPSYYLGLYFASTGSENAGGYANDELDQIVADLEEEFDQDARREAAEDAERIILADCPDVFIGSAVMNAVEGPNVTGYSLYPVEYYGVTAEVK